ncbi:hypothetical protein Tco_1530970 [Tanacetum coccineum]
MSSDYKEPSDVGSPEVVVYGYDGILMHPPSPDYVPRPEHPPSPDYVPGPEHPPSPVYVPYVPEPEYPEYLVPSDAEVPLEDQPLPANASPTALSPGYVADFDPEEDLEEDHADYPADRGDGDDEPSDNDDDDDDADDEDEEAFEDEDDDEEEEEHLAPTDSSAIPVIIVPPSQTLLRRVQKTVKPQTPISFPPKAEVDRLLALLTSPPSPLSPWSSPLPQIPSPPLPISSPSLSLPSPLTTSPTDAGTLLGYRAAEIRMRAASPPL